MIRWTSCLLVTLLLSPLAWLLPPVLALLARDRHGLVHNGNREGVEPRLPVWLDWFQTPDNSLLGDDGHKARWAGWPRYMQMVAWLWRNRLYGLRWSMLSVRVEAGDKAYVTGNMLIKNRTNGVAGHFFLKYGGAWQYKAVYQVWGGMAIQINLGWVLDSFFRKIDTGVKSETESHSSGRAIFTSSVRITEFVPLGDKIQSSK